METCYYRELGEENRLDFRLCDKPVTHLMEKTTCLIVTSLGRGAPIGSLS